MIVIGEKINGTREEVAQAIKKRDVSFIKELALRQVAAGADFLDINAGTLPEHEPEDMVWLVNNVQEVVDCPLCLDSTNPVALAAGIKAAQKTPMVNSLSGESNRIENVLPLALEHQTELIALALDDDGIPKTAEKRLEIIRRMISLTREGGLADEKIYVDPLIVTAATDETGGVTALNVIRAVKEEFPDVHITSGLSNISFGLPVRTIINQAFAATAIAAGMDSAIIDPENTQLRAIVLATELILGMDNHCLKYNNAIRSGIIGPDKKANGDFSKVAGALQTLVEEMASSGIIAEQQASLLGAAASGETEITADTAAGAENIDQTALDALVEAMAAMDESTTMALTEKYLADDVDPMKILSAAQDGMGKVGELFEKEEYFIPELILAGEMMGAIAGKVKPHIKESGDVEEKKRGKVIMATVEGDIHDIGKNIVSFMLDINGYDVLDLGVDVPAAKIVEAAKEFKPHVIGLCCLLTLAYEPMKDTIKALKAAGIDCPVMIGGAQLEGSVVRYVGADDYGSHALDAVKLCDKWITA